MASGRAPLHALGLSALLGGLLPRLERGELVLEGWEELDEPTRAGITRWLEHAGHRERVAGLLNKTHVAQGGI